MTRCVSAMRPFTDGYTRMPGEKGIYIIICGDVTRGVVDKSATVPGDVSFRDVSPLTCVLPLLIPANDSVTGKVIPWKVEKEQAVSPLMLNANAAIYWQRSSLTKKRLL